MNLRRFQINLCIRWDSGYVAIVLCAFPSLLDVYVSFQDTEQNLNKKCIFAFDNLINLSCRTVDLIQGVNCNSINENVSDLVLLNQDEFIRDVQERLECPEVGFPVDDQLLIVIKLYRYFHCC